MKMGVRATRPPVIQACDFIFLWYGHNDFFFKHGEPPDRERERLKMSVKPRLVGMCMLGATAWDAIRTQALQNERKVTYSMVTQLRICALHLPIQVHTHTVKTPRDFKMLVFTLMTTFFSIYFP